MTDTPDVYEATIQCCKESLMLLDAADRLLSLRYSSGTVDAMAVTEFSEAVERVKKARRERLEKHISDFKGEEQK